MLIDIPKYLTFDFESYCKIFSYCLNAKGEISGLAKSKTVEMNRTRYLKIYSPKIFKQRNNSVHTTMSGDVLSKFIVELAQQNQSPKNWNVWWHTHNDFTAHFSSEDEMTIKRMSESSRLISICVNKMGEIACRFDFKGETESLTPTLLPNIKSDMFKECKDEIKEKVKNQKRRRIIHHGTSHYSKAIREIENETVILAPNGLGQSEETSPFPDYDGRSGSNREFLRAYFGENGSYEY